MAVSMFVHLLTNAVTILTTMHAMNTIRFTPAAPPATNLPTSHALATKGFDSGRLPPVRMLTTATNSAMPKENLTIKVTISILIGSTQNFTSVLDGKRYPLVQGKKAPMIQPMELRERRLNATKLTVTKTIDEMRTKPRSKPAFVMVEPSLDLFNVVRI
jgi:hypothetical protein